MTYVHICSHILWQKCQFNFLLVQFHLPWYKIQINVKSWWNQLEKKMAKGPHLCWLWGIKALRDIQVVVHSCRAPGKSGACWPLDTNVDYSLALLVLLQWWVIPLNISKLKGLSNHLKLWHFPLLLAMCSGLKSVLHLLLKCYCNNFNNSILNFVPQWFSSVHRTSRL